MPFPLSPTNGQQITLNGVTYEYSSSNGTWTKIPATLVNAIDQFARDKANSANVSAQAAFNQANTSSSNTIYTQGVDATQNTRITAVDAFAQSAYNKANTGGEYAIDNVARLTANAAFDKANSANVLAQAAFNAANAASSFSFDQYARDTANSASSNTIVLQGVNLTQNTNITAVNNFASGAYNKANSADDLAQSAFNKANSSNVLAQASFNTANTKLNSSGGTISGDLTVTGNLFVSGNTTTYTSNNVVINDPIILLANNNTGNALDVGFVAHYIENDILKHTGLVKDVSTNTWYLFDNYTPEIQGTNLLNPNDTSLRISTVKANLISNSVFISGYDALAYTQASFNKANTAASDIAIIQGVDVTQNTRITAVDSFAGGAYNQANTVASDITVIQGVNTTQNTRITAVDSFAQAAYNKANTGTSVSLGGFAANNVLTVNSAGYISNTANLNFYSSNNTLVVTGNVVGGGIRSTSSATAPSNPVVGDIWYDTSSDVTYRYTNDGSNSYWIDVSGPEFSESLPSYRSIVEFVATANQNSFSTIYTVGSVDILRNGLRLSTSDYVANNGTSVILSDPCNANDIVTIINFYTTSLNVVLSANGRISGVANGTILWNTANNVLEAYTGIGWTTLASQNYRIDYLIVAAGGGGGGGTSGGGGGGGGAGGYISSFTTVIPNDTYTVTVGGGGAAGTNSNGVNGSNSAIVSINTSIGGGGGGSASTNLYGNSGGSGGGSSATTPGVVYSGGAGTSGQGNAGGSGYHSSGYHISGGGGGGADAVGSNSSQTTSGAGGAGGNGLNWLSLGTFYAGGGGGGIHYIGTSGGAGGAGGGGQGGTKGDNNATAGTTNSGGGGGGSGDLTPTPAKAGGSGIVIVRYSGGQRGSGGTITSSGGYTYHTFTSSGTFTA
jgi:hypothetical protein